MIDGLTPKVRLAAGRWDLDVTEALARTRRATLWKAEGPFGDCVLKVYATGDFGGERNAAHFLSALGPEAAVAVHGVDPDLGALVMDWLPGPKLSRLVARGRDDRATRILADLARRIAGTDFGDVSAWSRIGPRIGQAFEEVCDRHCAPGLRRDIRRAGDLAGHLLDTGTAIRPVHGDLHHGNVIVTDRGPRVFDPKAYLAEGAFELAHALRNPSRDLSPDAFRSRTLRRAAIWAEACGTTSARLTQWAAVKCAQSILFRAGGRPVRDREETCLHILLDMAGA